MIDKALFFQISMVASLAGFAGMVLYGFWVCHLLKPGLAAHEPEILRDVMRSRTPENAILGLALDKKRSATLHCSLQPGLRRIRLVHRLNVLPWLCFAAALLGSMTT